MNQIFAGFRQYNLQVFNTLELTICFSNCSNCSFHFLHDIHAQYNEFILADSISRDLRKLVSLHVLLIYYGIKAFFRAHLNILCLYRFDFVLMAIASKHMGIRDTLPSILKRIFRCFPQGWCFLFYSYRKTESIWRTYLLRSISVTCFMKAEATLEIVRHNGKNILCLPSQLWEATGRSGAVVPNTVPWHPPRLLGHLPWLSKTAAGRAAAFCSSQAPFCHPWRASVEQNAATLHSLTQPMVAKRDLWWAKCCRTSAGLRSPLQSGSQW